MVWLGVLIAMLIVFGVVWRRAKRPYVHRDVRQGELRKYLEVLFYRGYDGGFVCVQIPGDTRFVQFSKYIMSGARVGLQFDFPLASWSREYYEPLKALLREEGIPYEIDKTRQPEVAEFLVVDVKHDLKLASDLSRLVLQKLYKVHEDSCVELYFGKVSPRDERIGFA